MSGGSFDYAYFRVYQFADELQNKLDKAKEPNDYGEVCYDYDDETIVKLSLVESKARQVAALMREVEWLYSGDTGPETFKERLESLGF